jgi:hypothetical protein
MPTTSVTRAQCCKPGCHKNAADRLSQSRQTGIVPRLARTVIRRVGESLVEDPLPTGVIETPPALPARAVLTKDGAGQFHFTWNCSPSRQWPGCGLDLLRCFGKGGGLRLAGELGKRRGGLCRRLLGEATINPIWYSAGAAPTWGGHLSQEFNYILVGSQETIVEAGAI